MVKAHFHYSRWREQWFLTYSTPVPPIRHSRICIYTIASELLCASGSCCCIPWQQEPHRLRVYLFAALLATRSGYTVEYTPVNTRRLRQLERSERNWERERWASVQWGTRGRSGRLADAASSYRPRKSLVSRAVASDRRGPVLLIKTSGLGIRLVCWFFFNKLRKLEEQELWRISKVGY